MTSMLAQDVGTQQTISTAGRFAEATVFVEDTLLRQVELTQVRVGGQDVLLGGPGRDDHHAGAGDDVVNGGPGEDAVFGDDGVDAMWGGTEHDRLYAGFGDDLVDIKPRRDVDGIEDDPTIWFEVAPEVDTNGEPDTNGLDLVYGGDGADAMQADVAANGQQPGDRLFDWYGAHNINYVCASTNGAAVYDRGPAPATREFLQVLSLSDGLVDVASDGTPGARELALVTDGNRNPPHPDTPGHFTCEGSVGARGDANGGGETTEDQGNGDPGRGQGRS